MVRTVERFEDKPAHASLAIGFDPEAGLVDLTARFRLGGFSIPALPCATYREALERTRAYIERTNQEGASGILSALRDRLDDLKQPTLFN